MQPTPGRIVLFHHAEDGRDWPAMVLDVRTKEWMSEEPGELGPGQMGSAGIVEKPQSMVECQLQVMRPRGNFWPWASEGEKTGQWSWPRMTAPSNHERALEDGGKSE